MTIFTNCTVVPSFLYHLFFKVVRTIGEEAEEPAAIPAKRPRMTVDEPIDETGRKGKKSRAGVMSVAERLQSNMQLSPNSQGEPDHVETDGKLMVPSMKLGQYDKATIRIIAQFLDNIGLQSSVAALVEETGFHIETSSGARIRANILKGNYDAASSILRQSQDLDPELAQWTSHLIQCFKLSDLVRKERYIEALFVMRGMCTEELHGQSKKTPLFCCFMKDVMLGGAKYQHVDSVTSRNSQLAFLEELLPPDFILPQNRLRSVLNKLHGAPTADKATKLLCDDASKDPKITPYRCIQLIETHKTPVYCVKFSRNGKLMASGGKSNAITLWKTMQGKLHKVGDLNPIPEGDIAYMEFCQKNRFLAVCGGQTCKYNLTVFDVESRAVFRTLRVHPGHDDVVDIGSFYTCCSFLTNPIHTMIVAGNELGALKVYNLTSQHETGAFKQVTGFRVRALHGMRNGSDFLTVDAHNRVRMYSLLARDMEGTTICKEDVTIINMVVHPSERLVLVTTDCNLRLWDIRTHNLVRVFNGACQREEFARYSIHATFGGVYHSYIATGSIGKETEESLIDNDKTKKKDGRVIIWSVEESRPKFSFVGHKGHVNAVTWHPKDPTMLVSCGDDGTVRVWSLDRSQTSESSSAVPRRITRKEKYEMIMLRHPVEEEPSTSATNGNEQCESTSRTTELIKNLKLKTDFQQDLNMEKKWFADAGSRRWELD